MTPIMHLPSMLTSSNKDNCLSQELESAVFCNNAENRGFLCVLWNNLFSIHIIKNTSKYNKNKRPNVK